MVALSPNALRVFEAHYSRRDAARRIIERPFELFERVARTVSGWGLSLFASSSATQRGRRSRPRPSATRIFESSSRTPPGLATLGGFVDPFVKAGAR